MCGLKPCTNMLPATNYISFPCRFREKQRPSGMLSFQVAVRSFLDTACKSQLV